MIHKKDKFLEAVKINIDANPRIDSKQTWVEFFGLEQGFPTWSARGPWGFEIAFHAGAARVRDNISLLLCPFY